MTDHLTARYGLIHGAYWASYAAIAAYVNLYLLEMGFSSGAIGVLIALAGLLSALLQPLAASYADRETSPNLKAINLAIAALWMLSALGLLVFHKNKVASLLFYGGCLSLLQLQTPLVNGLGVTSINCGCKLNYGVSKSVSSVTYALVCLVLGRMTAAQGGRPVPWAIVLLTGVFILSLVLYPAQRAPRSDSEAKGLAFFRKYPRFTGVLAGCILLYISHVFLNSFTLQIIRTKGGDSSHMGLSMAIAALSEIPTMLLFTHMLRKRSSSFYIKVTGFFFLLKAAGSWLAPNVTVYYIFQATQIGAWALIAIASVYYVNAIMEPQDAVKGQAYFTAAYTLANVLAAPLGGRLIDTLGVNAMLMLGALCAALGTAVNLVFAEKTVDKGIL
jgi:PPP family 3-phenylpropionic acid transporter